MIEVVKRYMDREWAVFPVVGKHPATRHGLKDASTEHRLADIWYERYPGRGVALSTGHASGVWVLDLDSQAAIDRLAALQEEHGALPETITSKTRNGYHVLWAMPDEGDVRNSAGKIADGIDVRGTGGYVVLPPSPHPDGGEYRWIKGRSPDDMEPATAPEWLLALARSPGTTTGAAAFAPELPEEITQGGRNHMLTSLAGSLRRRGGSKSAIVAALDVENRERCVPPLPDDEVRKIAASVARYAPAPPSTNGSEPDGHHEIPVDIELVDGAVLDRIRADKLKPLSVVPTPWPTWNRVCRGAGGGEGLAHGWHVIIGASSGAGKSLVATNLAAHAVRAGEHVVMMSLEMSQAEVVTRLLAIYGAEEAKRLEHGRGFDRRVWDAASERLLEAEGSIRINREPIRGLHDIEAAMERYAEEGCKVAIVDYLQLAWVRTADTMYQQVTEVSHAIRGMAQKHGILSVGLSQVNRQMSFGGGDMRKEGLLGGSSLENDADQVVLLSKPEPEGTIGYRSTATLDKNRHGPQTEWEAILRTDTLQIREAMPDEQPHRSMDR